MTDDSKYAIIIVMNIVVDTNVLYQSFRSNKGASHYVFKLIREEKVTLLVSTAVLSEYEEILARNKTLFGLINNEIRDIIIFFAFIGKKIIPHYLWRPI